MIRLFMTAATVVALGSAPAMAAAGEQTNLFAGTLFQSLAAMIVFLALLAVLYKYAWGPILNGLHDRETKIKNDLERAELAARQAEQTLADYRTRLADAQAEAHRLIDQGRSDAARVAEQLRQQTQAEINQMRQRATDDIRAARQQAVADLYAQAAVLSTQIAGRILRREINPDDQQRLVDEALAELNESRAGGSNN